MLRIIVIALLAGNLLLLGFHASSAPIPTKKVRFAVQQTPSDLPQIKLIDELDDENLQAAAGRQCFSVGPFETVNSRNKVAEQLQPLVADIKERESEALVELGYWVSLPAYPDFAAAAVDMKDLGKQGLEDIAVITDSAGEYRVSLGYFLDERNARARRNQVRELGFEAETRLQRQNQPRYWLDYEQPADIDEARVVSEDVTRGLQRSIPCS